MMPTAGEVTVDRDIDCYVVGGGHSLRSFDQVMDEIDRVTDELQQTGAPTDGVMPLRGSIEAWRYLEHLRAQLSS